MPVAATVTATATKSPENQKSHGPQKLTALVQAVPARAVAQPSHSLVPSWYANDAVPRRSNVIKAFPLADPVSKQANPASA